MDNTVDNSRVFFAYLLVDAAHGVLQLRDVLERVRGHHAVVVVGRRQQHRGVLHRRVGRGSEEEK